MSNGPTARAALSITIIMLFKALTFALTAFLCLCGCGTRKTLETPPIAKQTLEYKTTLYDTIFDTTRIVETFTRDTTGKTTQKYTIITRFATGSVGQQTQKDTIIVSTAPTQTAKKESTNRAHHNRSIATILGFIILIVFFSVLLLRRRL